jgi:formate dehydrogenase subunit gamma
MSDPVQTNSYDPEAARAIIEDVLESLREKRGALLPILHGIQAELGFIPEDAVPLVARTLNLSRAEVHGVVTFYHDFRTERPGKRTLRICQAESCQAAGGRELTRAALETVGVGFGETTPDEAITLEKVYCLGNCALSPSIMVGESVYGRVTPARLREILAREGSTPMESRPGMSET